MTKELATQDDFTSQLAEFDKIQDTCRKLLQTKHYQALGESGIHAIMARAKALGIHPFEALNGGFHCINGKVGMSTEMMAALIRRRGHSVTKDPKSHAECVILHGKRADNGDTWTCSFTRQDAEAAGLWNSATWKKYSQVMLYNRAMSMLFRQLFPDLSLGAGYVEDELREITKTGDYKETLDIPVENLDNVKPLYIAQPEEKHKIERISTDQAVELGHYLDECDPIFLESVLGFIKAACGGDKLADLPLKHYEATKQKAIANRDEFIAKQLAEVG